MKLVDLRPEDTGKEFTSRLLVTEISDVVSYVDMASFKCQSCTFVSKIVQEVGEKKYPLECDKDIGGCGKRATSTHFKFIPEESTEIALQKIEVQDLQYQSTRQPVCKMAHCYSELVEQVEPGDEIEMTYIVKSSLLNHDVHKSFTRYVYLEPIENGIKHIDRMKEAPDLSDEEMKVIQQLKKDDPWKVIAESIAPWIVGFEVEKRILALCLFSGLGYQDGDAYVRDSLTSLMVGDPGTAKSDMLKFLSSLLPRGQFTVGGQASHARLVGTATRNEGSGKWTIKAGKFALANQSIHCIDELGEFSKETLGSLREAMSLQTIHVDKGDKSVCFKTNEIIVAAMNPKGDRFNEESNLISQIDSRKVSPALISRFDWLMFVVDGTDKDRDDNVCDQIWDNSSGHIPKGIISKELLGKMVILRRDRTPKLPANLKPYMRERYGNMRQVSGQKWNEGREITPRQLQTCINSIKALCRIKDITKATKKEAGEIMDLYESNLKSVTNGSMNIDDIFTVSSQDDRTMVEKIMGSISDGGKSQEELNEEFGEDVSSFVEKLSRRGDIYINLSRWRKA